MNTWVWMLTFTILGSVPEHGTIAKFQTRSECEERLQAMRKDAQQEGKKLVGACSLLIQTTKNK